MWSCKFRFLGYYYIVLKLCKIQISLWNVAGQDRRMYFPCWSHISCYWCKVEYESQHRKYTTFLSNSLQLSSLKHRLNMVKSSHSACYGGPLPGVLASHKMHCLPITDANKNFMASGHNARCLLSKCQARRWKCQFHGIRTRHRKSFHSVMMMTTSDHIFIPVTINTTLQISPAES